MPKVLHIHQDYPDGQPYPATRAVSNLIQAVETNHETVSNFVISINRTSNPFKMQYKTFDQGVSIVYWGMPLPFIHTFSLFLLACFLKIILSKQTFSCVHGHKLTSEGYLAYRMSKFLKIPYIISIRGGTDLKNINRLKVHKKLFAKILQNAKAIFWVSPWAKQHIETALNIQLKEKILFPNICHINPEQEVVSSNELQSPSRFIMVISYHQYLRKGVLQLIDAFEQFQHQTDYFLDVYGQGDEATRALLNSKLESRGIQNIRFHGAIDQKQLREEMKHCQAMLLPSINETFGMAYIEALSVGCPIMYMANTGIDGFFEEHDIGVRLEDQSVDSIVQGLNQLTQNAESIRENIRSMINKGYLKLFIGQTISKVYINTLTEKNVI